MDWGYYCNYFLVNTAKNAHKLKNYSKHVEGNDANLGGGRDAFLEALG